MIAISIVILIHLFIRINSVDLQLPFSRDSVDSRQLLLSKIARPICRTHKGPIYLLSTRMAIEAMDPAAVIGRILRLIQTSILLESKAKCLKLNCQILVHCIKPLGPFVQEVKESKIILDSVAISWFLDLEHVLIGAKELLESLGPNANMFYVVLLSSQYVIEFQEISQTICTSLKKLCADSLPFSEPNQRQLNGCISDLEGAEYSIDRQTEQLMEDIAAALKDIDAGIFLDHNRLTSFAERLGFNSNQEALRQSSLLEQWKDLTRHEKNMVEEDLICRLINLATQISDDLVKQKEAEVEAELAGIAIPTDIRCPLSLELMSDPVIIASGQTYERVYIQQWLDQGNTTCPKTRQELSHKNLIANYTLKTLITNWCESNNVLLPEPPKLVPVAEGDCVLASPSMQMKPYHNKDRATLSTLCNRGLEDCCLNDLHASSPLESNQRGNSSPYNSNISGELERANNAGSCGCQQIVKPADDLSVADGNSVRIEVERLVEGLLSDSVDVQREAVSELRLLARQSSENRVMIASCGAITPLVSLLSSDDLITQENAVTTLLNLSINNNNKYEIAAAGAIDFLVEVLKVGTPPSRENAAATLFSLSIMDENKVTVGQSGAIPPLVDLLISGTRRGKKDAVNALFNLSICHENKARIVRAGAVKPVVELMTDPAAGMVDKAVAVLANLAATPEGRVAIGDEGGIPALVEVVEMGSPRGKENAAAALLYLCSNSNGFRRLVWQQGAIPPLFTLSKSGTARAKEKAFALLRLFREQRQHGGHGRASGDGFSDHP